MLFITASTIANMTVFKKLPIANQSTNLSTSITIKTVIKNDTNQNVRKFRGAVIKRSNQPTMAFNTHNSTATINASTNQYNMTPGAT